MVKVSFFHRNRGTQQVAGPSLGSTLAARLPHHDTGLQSPTRLPLHDSAAWMARPPLCRWVGITAAAAGGSLPIRSGVVHASWRTSGYLKFATKNLLNPF